MIRKLLLALSLFTPVVAFGQDLSVRYQGQAISNRGLPFTNQNVAVCGPYTSSVPNTNTQPCSPLATLATSSSTTSGGTNPTTTDTNGNFFFYAAPGKYLTQIYGPQISGQFVQPDITLACQPTGNCSVSGAMTVFKVNNQCMVGGASYPTIQSAIADTSCSFVNAMGYNTTETWSTDVLGGIARPMHLKIFTPLEIDLTHTQSITTNNVSIEFMGPNAAINQVGSANPEAPQTPGLRFKATSSLAAPMLSVTGPILGFDLTNIHFDCNANATMAISADRMQMSRWIGMISADNCTAIGFKFPNNASGGVNNGANQDTAFNTIDMLFVTRSPGCVEFDQNSFATANFPHNTIRNIGCSVLGSSGVTDQVLFNGADDNNIENVYCQTKGGTGSSKSCVHFTAAAYGNFIAMMDPGAAGPAVIQDGPNNYANVISNISLGNWLTQVGNTLGNQVITTGTFPRIIWTDTWFHQSVDDSRAQLDFTAQSANMGTTTAVTSISNEGMHLVTCYVVVTQAATTSSTLPTCQISFRDRYLGAGGLLPLAPMPMSCPLGASNNTAGTNCSSTLAIDPAGTTGINFSTTGYASSGATAMQYALRFTVITISGT